MQKATTPSLMIEDFSDYEVDRISNKEMEILSLQSNLFGSKRAKSHDQDSIINALLLEVNQSKVNGFHNQQKIRIISVKLLFKNFLSSSVSSKIFCLHLLAKKIFG